MAEAAPVVDALVLAVLRASLGADRVGSRWPVDLMSRLPYVVASVLPGGRQPDIRFAAVAVSVQVDVHAADLATAYSVADGARLALLGAWSSHTSVNGAVINRVRTVSVPREISTSGQPSGLSRVIATYAITARA